MEERHRIEWIQSLPFLAMQRRLRRGVLDGRVVERYFAHRSYRTGRVFQFVLAWIGCSAAQKGPLWWAAHHRHHHRHSDRAADVHSPEQEGFWWSHAGWILSRDYNDTDLDAIKDFVNTRSCHSSSARSCCTTRPS